MIWIDWLIVLAYLVLTLWLGLYLSRRASRSLVDFFVSGRSLPWWLAGTSMAATTFSIDTPLYIAGVVGTRGIAGNWEWWSFGIAHVVMIYVFSRLWRRSEIVTDAELTELRYGGRTGAALRGIKAFLFAVPINCIGIGYAMLAMVKVITALELWESLGVALGDNTKLWSVIGVSIFVLVYAGFSGLWGVVATDFFQFFLALFGAIVVAGAALIHIGGMPVLIDQIKTQFGPDTLALVPMNWGEGGLRWSETAGISANTFLAYIALQWWAFRRSDGGGEFIQRLAASKNEAEAEKAAWFFNILHYVVRTWPWVVVALVALVVYPGLEDRELGYPKLMLDFLPPVLLGLVVASLIAAFMSTVSTLINWGASYLTNDLYARFIAPDASGEQLVFAGRVASVLVTVLGAIAAFYSDNVTTLFRLVIAIGTGPGLVLILRWFWWRINAAAELASMLAGFLMGLLTMPVADPNAIQNPLVALLYGIQTEIPILETRDFGERLLLITSVTTVIWVATMLLTSSESPEILDRFYRKVHPAGPGWNPQRVRAGEAPIRYLTFSGRLPHLFLEPPGVLPEQNIFLQLQQVLAALCLLFGSMFAVGGFLLLQPNIGWLSLLFAAAGSLWLRQLRRSRITPMPRPGLEDVSGG
ncbi:Na+:solute symporter [Oscillatoria sp. CS-180]|uniref:sodium:solute symporter family protein n=1 Tax=Oscillatoria sp. CS-180 TaxID=3021720 RepID=UPI00232E09E6|nr:sodium:solute symporter family protein [Oscillatoria sp. CS-180]MDB9528567.1 Na+:solute symporter [Oscillatoria sp. CS-180]